ncbi:integrase [Prosthecobacter dejongeii]|uniref:Integrase n=2 Tax=Prosthecobacter dejongeii TaxID=48465 RepID=A0A7W7YN36_9BACT|nr:integrase [Prosthecobacter dejongeii]
MPAKEHLWRRGSTYYFRMRFPRDLLRAGVAVMVNGKPQKHEVKFSLNTSDYREAVGLVATHSAIWTDELAKRRRELNDKKRLDHQNGLIATSCKSSPAAEVPDVLSDERIRAIVISAFISSQQYSAKIIDGSRGEEKEDRFDRLADLSRALVAYQGGDEKTLPADLHSSLRRHLSLYGLENLPEESDAFQSLLRGYRAALIEDTNRLMHYLDSGSPAEFDSQFRGIHAASPMPDTGAGATVDELLKDFDKDQHNRGVSESTHKANVPVFRALREFFGPHTPLSKITQKEMRDFFDFVDKIPVNCQQRYPKKKLAEAITLEAESPSPQLLAPKTLKMYHGRVVTMWRHAMDLEWVKNNPASIRLIASRYVVEEKSKRQSFTIEELNTIFHAPLYTGCEGDLDGWNKPGANVLKRGRFWVPLLALFQGFRCNEACQLEIADIGEKEGIPIINITDESDDEETDHKRVKNSTSRTHVPIHPTILKMGFLDFVNQRKTAGVGSLFPELPRDKSGVYSSTFSKWFGRFLDKTFEAKGTKTKSTFHCFRHTFRDAALIADIGSEAADRLGRWKTVGGTGRLYGNGFPLSVLRDKLALIEFAGVDFSHLIPTPPRVRNTVYPEGHPKHI